MEASPARIIQYFNGEKQNLIPLFQRPYSWNKGHWQTLWEDMLVHYDLEDRSTHFMGAIVSVPARSVPVGVNKYLIIDGQQRLATVSLLLCALRDLLEKNTADRIQEVYLINRFRDPEDILSSHENPKICGIDDAEVVGDLIAVDMPIPRHLLA
jgi:uncharacterized protein with ParB-like and HNH nuclease domain